MIDGRAGTRLQLALAWLAKPGHPKARPGGQNRSLGHHHLNELLVVDLPVAVHVGLADHLVHLLVRELLAKVRHHVPELRALMKPLPSRSKTLKASTSSSSVS